MYACVVSRENKMPNKLLLKATPLITAVLLLTLLAAPVFAQDPGKLWFFSVDPASLATIPPLPNPEDVDPNYVDTDTDDWIKESIVIEQSNWTSPFSIWIGLHGGAMSYDTMLVISVNDVAKNAIASMTVTPGAPGGIGAWNLVAPIPPGVTGYPIAPHGVLNSAEWAGYVEVNVGDIASETAIQVTFVMTLNTDLTGAKIHFDAYGWTSEEHGDYTSAAITSPYSHDSTFVVPEAATILAVASSLAALGTYAYKRKKQ